MGRVWVAHHLGLGVDVAVKLIARRDLARHAELRAGFDREARAAARIASSPSISVSPKIHRNSRTSWSTSRASPSRLSVRREAAIGCMPWMNGAFVKAIELRYQPKFSPVTGWAASGQTATLVHWYLPSRT